MIRLSMLGAALVLATCGALALHQPGALVVGTPETKMVFVAVLGVSAAIYLLAVRQVRQQSGHRLALWLVLLVALALRIGPLLAPPFLSSDVFRYVWDGRVQAAWINPYRFIPADPALAGLRDAAVFPHINRADYAPTIYPPTAQVVFALIGRIWPTVTGVKLAMVGFEALAVACLIRLLAMAGLPRELVLIYAWNPLPVWAFAGNGHVDAVSIGLIALSLLLRAKHRDAWSGAALGLATLVKFLPVVIAPALWRPGAGWRLATACGVVLLALYLPYLSVGWRVFGFLGNYGAEEGLASGTGVWLLAGLSRFGPLPAAAGIVYGLAAVFVLAALSGWVAFRQRPDTPVGLGAAAGLLMAALTVLISPHYPWYFAWLAVPAVLAPSRALLWLCSAPVLLYLDTGGDRFVLPCVVYGPALLLALADWWRQPRPSLTLQETR